jgi:SAM-dependent methyltransferase
VKRLAAPSPLFQAHLDAVVVASGVGAVLDLACGRGRHALAAAELGVRVTAIDRHAPFLAELADRARRRELPLEVVRADLETSRGIPVMPGSCGAIFVFRFLFRPLAGAIAAALRPGGLLLYETFTQEQARLEGGPSNPAFLLAPGELPTLFPSLEILEHWEGRTDGERPQAIARLAARRPA